MMSPAVISPLYTYRTPKSMLAVSPKVNTILCPEFSLASVLAFSTAVSLYF